MRAICVISSYFVICGVAIAQDRDTKVRNDREAFRSSREWIYNDLAEGIRVAKDGGKPLLVVFRCIPCEACQEFDDDVARRDPIIRDLLDKFVCVRIVFANNLDLNLFQFDFDLSFAIVFMNPDRTIYGRFGTRSERDESADISLAGLRKAMARALAMHADYGQIRPTVAGKQVLAGRYKTPREYPSLAGKYQASLNYENQVAKSCIHCHQVGEAIRQAAHGEEKRFTERMLFPYPDPAVLGLTMSPKECATVSAVAPGSAAYNAGLRAGDEIFSLGGQPLLSTADLQWVLHNTADSGDLIAQARRGEGRINLTLHLAPGWRRGDISWRATTWELRRLGFGGMRLDDLADDERAETGLAKDALALRVRHVGEFGDHAVAKRAGVQKGDIIIAFDGKTARMNESAILAETVLTKSKGEPVSLLVLRAGSRVALRYKLP
jgi:hypothetical protein